jgi:hypothetical protein
MTAASDSVFTNSDVSRIILSQAVRPVSLLQTSRVIRGSEPCHSLYEHWHHYGCPYTSNSAIESGCLAALGGVTSVFCEGYFEVTGSDGKQRTGVRAAAVAQDVIHLLNSTATTGGRIVIEINFGNTELKIVRDGHDQPMLIATQDGWRKKGAPCRPSINETTGLINSLLRQTGSILLPCTPVAPPTVKIPREIHIRVMDEGGTIMLSAVRR